MDNFKIDNILKRQVIISGKRKNKPNLLGDKVNTIPKCPFCEVNNRKLEEAIISIGSPWRVKIVKNKYPIVSENGNDVRGEHYVVIEGQEHIKSLNQYTEKDYIDIFESYRYMVKDLESRDYIKYIQIFKNYKKEAGISIEHPHSQIIALNMYPTFLKDGCQYEKNSNGMLLYEGKYFNLSVPEVQVLDYTLRIYSKAKKFSFSNFNNDELIDLSKVFELAIKLINLRLGDSPLNICYYFCGKDKHNLSFFVDIIPRKSTFAGFEIATGITVNTVTMDRCYQEFKDILITLKKL